MLTGVPAAGDAEAKIEVKVLQKTVSEVVPLDHTEVGDRLVPHGELHPAGREKGEIKPTAGQSSWSPPTWQLWGPALEMALKLLRQRVGTLEGPSCPLTRSCLHHHQSFSPGCKERLT